MNTKFIINHLAEFAGISILLISLQLFFVPFAAPISDTVSFVSICTILGVAFGAFAEMALLFFESF